MAEKQKSKSVKKYKLYQISGNKIERKNKFCPKCNSFMAKHQNRWTCGNCRYTEFVKNS